ncbi:ComF family protein [Corynebacterium timonense]|uniref:Predicted amidophosphoribosyltransferases n=1 Tax=Corynebacterium timonense TaxID=441500 RepID=A0A1H1RQZ1_9CORY|nr:ComF family protein [Corynebacterium timonense]SDS38074.1 Predicted amidophosphoribosyltransferases [Corynebacterium timonense]
MLELLLPRRCAGCGAAGEHVCARCRAALSAAPQRVSPPTFPHVPVFAFGTYAGAHRGIVLAMKERANLAVRRHAGAVLAAGLDTLAARGEIPQRVGLVPAPTRARSARARGGDPVEALCRASGRDTWPVLSLGEGVADQAGLGAQQRRANLSGRVRAVAAPAGALVLVDDVVTTGATLQASVEKLCALGGDVVACLVFCAA